MQQPRSTTQGHLRKKDRIKSRKFSAEEPYDRATDEQLIGSALGGGRTATLQPGTLVQNQPTTLSRESSKQSYTQQPQTYIGSNNNTNYLTTNSQDFVRPRAMTADNTYPANYSTQSFPQQSFTNNTGIANNYPMNYNNQAFTQQSFTQNTGTVPQQNLYTGTGLQQDPYGGIVYQEGLYNQSNLSYDPNFVNNTGMQNLSQPGLIYGTALGTGLGMGTVYATGTNSYSGTQGLAQPLQNTGIISNANTIAPTNNLSAAPVSTDNANQYGANTRGTFIFRPLEGKFTQNKDVVSKMDPYCKIKIGMRGGKTSVAKSEGTHPVWSDVITIEKKHNEQFAKIKVKDHDRFTLNDKIGEAKIPLSEVTSKGKINQWFPVYRKEQQTGEVLMEISFQPRNYMI